MDFQIVVFDPEIAGRTRADALTWYDDVSEHQTTLLLLQIALPQETIPAFEVGMLSPALRDVFEAIIGEFPDWSGAGNLAGGTPPIGFGRYVIGEGHILACFERQSAERAYAIALDLARHHGIGFYGMSAPDSEMWGPADSGGYVLYR